MADSTETPDSAVPEDPTVPVPSRGGAGFDPRRLLWLAVLATAGGVVVLAAWLFRTVSTERALQAVSSSVSLTADPVPSPATTAVIAAMPPPPPVPAPPATPEVPAAAPPPVATVVPPTAAAASAVEAQKAGRKGKSKKAQKAAKRRGTAAARGTFARCPALGKPGAVMCRWHICNGGAGKEAVCRPYLERRP